MDYNQTLNRFYTDLNYYCDNSYESLEWNEPDIPKPTDEELKRLWATYKNEYLKKIMKTKRNMLLSSTDYRMVTDFGYKEGEKEKWTAYREALRNLPLNWTEDTPFPEPPE